MDALINWHPDNQTFHLKHLNCFRQENLALQARLCNLEQRSRELLLQQGAAVSGAAVALSGLSSRLDGLIEQLVLSYNISEKDLEVVAALLVSSSAAGGSSGGGGGGAGCELAVSRMMEQAFLSKIFSAFTNTIM
jgi:mevalonate kinase